MGNLLKKGISSPIAIGIILVLAVLAGGFTLWQYSEMQKEELGGVEIDIPEKKEVRDVTSDWKIYENKEYGFEVKYPRIYTIEESSQGKSLIIGTSVMPYYKISITENISSLEKLKSSWQKSFNELLGRFIAPSGVEVTWKETVVSGKKAIEMSYEQFIGGYTGVVYSTGIIKNSTIYRIELVNGSEEEYYKILSTFRFAEPYIRVISPNGGEKWVVGNNYTIKWESEGIEKVNIWLYMPTPGPDGWPPSVIKSIAKDWLAEGGEYAFNLDENYYDFAENSRKLYGLANPAFKILIFKSGFYDKYDVSDNDFSVNEGYGFEFKYPEDFFWREPEFRVSDCDHISFPEECPDIGVTGAIVTEPVKLTVNDVLYCVQTTSEGAAGSTYIEYYYTTVKKKKCFTIYLVLKFTNCGVFGSTGDDAYEKCDHENKSTKPEILNQAISTFGFSE